MNNYLLIPLVSTLAGCLIALGLRAVFLKRMPRLFQKLAQRLAIKLFSAIDLPSIIRTKSNFAQIGPLVEEHIDEFLRHKLGKEMPMIGMFIGDKTIQQLKDIFMKELEEIFPPVMEKYFEDISGELDPRALIGKKIASLSKRNIRSLVYDSAGGWLRIFPIGGAIAGLAIGILQLAILWLTS